MSNKKLALIIALTYVSLGTALYLLLEHEVIKPNAVMTIFFPVIYGPFLIEMHETNVLLITALVQLISVIIWWGIVWGILAIFRRR